MHRIFTGKSMRAMDGSGMDHSVPCKIFFDIDREHDGTQMCEVKISTWHIFSSEVIIKSATSSSLSYVNKGTGKLIGLV